MVTMTSKCEFDRQNGVLKDYLPRHSFCSQYGFFNSVNGVLKDYLPRHSFCSQYGFFNSVNDKSHEDTDTRTYYFHVKFKILQQSGSQRM